MILTEWFKCNLFFFLDKERLEKFVRFTRESCEEAMGRFSRREADAKGNIF